MDTKVCKDCKQEKPLSEFGTYTHRPHLHRKQCKPCYNKYQNNRRDTRKSPDHELFVVEQLRKHDYLAMHGSYHRKHNFVDVLVGNVRIEVKHLKPQKRDSGYAAANTMKQRKDGWQADVLCIVFEGELYFFPVDHPAFYIDGDLRTKILYNPDSQREHITKNRKLTLDDMAKAHNRFELIDYAIRSQQIRPIEPRTRQLTLWPMAS